MADEVIESDTPCSSLAVEHILRLGTAGALWGLCSGPYDATKLGLSGFARTSFVARSMASFGIQCGFFAGVFSATRCGVERYRGQNDLFNASVAGAVAGALVAIRTRSLKQVAGLSALLATVGAAADYTRTQNAEQERQILDTDLP